MKLSTPENHQNPFTGGPVSQHLGGFTLKPVDPASGKCVQCAVVHDSRMPHNQQSLHWQYWFMEKNGRWPTWADAMEHCTPEMKAEWIRALAEEGVTV